MIWKILIFLHIVSFTGKVHQISNKLVIMVIFENISRKRSWEISFWSKSSIYYYRLLFQFKKISLAYIFVYHGISLLALACAISNKHHNKAQRTIYTHIIFIFKFQLRRHQRWFCFFQKKRTVIVPKNSQVRIKRISLHDFFKTGIWKIQIFNFFSYDV